MATIAKRGNKYSVVYNYIDEDGTTRQKWEPPVPTKKEAQKRKNEIEHEIATGTFIVPCKAEPAGRGAVSAFRKRAAAGSGCRAIAASAADKSGAGGCPEGPSEYQFVRIISGSAKPSLSKITIFLAKISKNVRIHFESL